MIEEEQTEGIVLRSTEYKEKQRIIALFTQDIGLIHLIVKGLSSKKPHLTALTSPLSKGEFLFKRGRSELFLFTEGKLLDLHLDLRNSLAALQAAGSVAQTLLQSQLPGKPAPLLYALFKGALQNLPFAERPDLLVAFFHLKFLQHEGLFHLSTLNEEFDSKETELIQNLLQTRQFSILRHFPIEEGLIKKLFIYTDKKIKKIAKEGI